nr:IS66 family insertion sequence element accessory protein TnpB [Burkholderia oklahomensis]
MCAAVERRRTRAGQGHHDHRRTDDLDSDPGEDAVFRFDDDLKVYLHRDPVDFRYGMNSLSILVEQSMRLNPMDASLYVFGNRRRDRIKILGWDGNGFWLLMKRLEADRFTWPDKKTDRKAVHCRGA